MLYMVTDLSCAVHLTSSHAHPIPNNKKAGKPKNAPFY